MIIFFGPAGAGKSVQGQILAARHGWRWVSAGQLLRDSRDPNILEGMISGQLVDSNNVNKIINQAIERAKQVEQIILDGYPRTIDQAKWLVENQSNSNQKIQLVVVLDVPPEESIRRLQIRGRLDDTKESIEERLKIYNSEVPEILDFMTDNNIPTIKINGMGSVGHVHDKIEEQLVKLNITQPEA